MLVTKSDPQPEPGTPRHSDEELKTAVRKFLSANDAESAVLLFEAIRGAARRTAHGGTRSERESFVDSAPADVLYPRESTGTSRLELFDLEHPFVPWLRTVLANLWVSHLDGLRRAIVNTDLLQGAEARPAEDRDAEAADLPTLSDRGLFTPAVVARLTAATNSARLVAFLAMSGLHRHFPEWESLLGRYEEEKMRRLPRPFPSLTVELRDTPRTRTAPLAQEMGIRKNNTLTQNWRRACADIRAAFPELALSHLSCLQTARGEQQ